MGRRVPVATALLATFAYGCLPIPWSKTYTMWPGGTVRVVDGAGAPVPSASVRVVRIRYPHSQEDEARVLPVDAKGTVTLTERKESLTVFPLMMHGVPGFSFEACAEAPGFAAARKRFDDPNASVEVTLAEGSRPCVMATDATIPRKGNARIEAIERDPKSDLVVTLVMSCDGPKRLSKKGAAPMEVLEVAWRAPSTAPLPRARLRVVDATGYAYGDVVDCDRADAEPSPSAIPDHQVK